VPPNRIFLNPNNPAAESDACLKSIDDVFRDDALVVTHQCRQRVHERNFP
jgi:hypothetical protein